MSNTTTPRKVLTPTRKVLTLEERVKVIRLSNEGGKSARVIARLVGVGSSQIHGILKRKTEILDDYENNSSPYRKRKMSTHNKGINDLVWKFVQDCRARNVPIKGPLLQEKALEFASDLKIGGFKASNGWLCAFYKRHNIMWGTISNERENVAGKVFEEWKLQLPEVSENPYKCDVCCKTFSANSSLQRHLQIHSGEKPYTCGVCGRSFSHNVYLNRHLKKIHIKDDTFNVCSKSFNSAHDKIKHTREKVHTCDICGISFSFASSLKRHLGRIHTGEKPFKCNMCCKSFKLEHLLHGHMRIHTKEKYLKCDICKKLFVRSYDLKRHLRLHTGEKSYTCGVCGKSFILSSYLHRHLRIHTGKNVSTCGICGKSFSLSSYLQIHLRIHTKQNVYTCDFCSITFNCASFLKRHIRTHAKPHKCDICSKIFSRSYSLKRHRKIHTGDKQ